MKYRICYIYLGKSRICYINLLQVLSWQIPKFHVKHGLFAMFINMAQDFYLHKNKSFPYMKIYHLLENKSGKFCGKTWIYFIVNPPLYTFY